MTEKIFKIMSNSGEYLTADTVAMALLKQVSMESSTIKAFFAVKEIKKGDHDSKEQGQICFVEE